MVPGLAMQAAGYAWVASIAGSSQGYGGYVIPLVVAGVGVSMVIPTASAAALSSVPPQALGKASGVSNTLQRFGSVFGIAIVTAVFDARGSLAGAVSITNGYRPALAVAAGFSLLGAMIALAVRKTTAAKAPAPTLRSQHKPAVVTVVLDPQ